MINVNSYAAYSYNKKLQPYSFSRRSPGPHDIHIKIRYSGICHSDIHQARNEWGGSTYPMVPGHEIAGVVAAVGKKVRRFRVGDAAGVGCFVDSCRKCVSCREGVEQYCEGHISWTYNGTEADQRTKTFGGYSTAIVVDENYALKIPHKMDLAKAAPLLCAGVTTYSPLKHFKVAKGQKVGVVGMGGLGHMAVKLAASMGAQVTVFSTSRSKAADAKRFGARQFVVTRETGSLKPHEGKYDLILDTVSAQHDLDAYLALLKRDRTMVIVGVPEKPEQIRAFSLIGRRRSLAGSVIGGIRETQEMLDYCARKGISADVEIIAASEINEAYERTLRGDVRYRFVIDANTF